MCVIISKTVRIVAIKVNGTPATSKTVVLDAGHGIPDYGICLTYFLRI